MDLLRDQTEDHRLGLSDDAEAAPTPHANDQFTDFAAANYRAPLRASCIARRSGM